jgi:uncharacterized protein YndB with AHSA1/START domain
MRASAEIVIDRPREAVWRWATDPEHWHYWQPDAADAATRAYEVSESTPPSRQVLRAESGTRFESTLELFEDVSGTRVRQTVDAAPNDALARIAFVLARPLARRDIRRQIAGQLARLKEMVELEAAL